jgi:nitrile hydratase
VDGIHDMGGMHGFGAVVAQPGEPVFHEPWEGRVVGLMVAAGAAGLIPGSLRPRIESMDPAAYLAASYYGRWAHALEAGLVATGTLTVDEIDTRVAGGDPVPTRSSATSPALVAAIGGFLDAPGATSGVPVAAAFAVGDRVTVRRMAPEGHHRCPRYVRGVAGTVTRVAGGWPHPGEHEPEAIYTVRFAMADLWGADAEPGSLALDRWERYLA